MSPEVVTPDDTRARLLDAAGHVFAESGFQAATVRDICARAGANVAAVNYHFGDKLGLYSEVLRQAVCLEAHEDIEAMFRSRSPARRKLRFVIGRMLRSMNDESRPAWATRLMLHEMAQPTPALIDIVEQMIRPKYQLLCRLIGEVISRPPADPETNMCVHSIVGQVRHYAIGREVITRLWPDVRFTPASLDKIADHITAFSMAGLVSLKRSRTRKESGER